MSCQTSLKTGADIANYLEPLQGALAAAKSGIATVLKVISLVSVAKRPVFAVAAQLCR
jgi:hypothetical protein